MAAKQRVGRDQAVQARRHGESFLGEADGRLEEPLPRQASVLRVRELQHAQHAGHADRAAGGDGFADAHRRAVGAQETVRARCRRRGFASVVGRDLLLRLIPVQQEGAAPDAGGLRFDQVEHHLHGDRRIQGAAARAQDLDARSRGMGIGRRHHGVRRLRRGQDESEQNGFEDELHVMARD